MTVTDLDHTVLQNLEFELPCEVKNRHTNTECPHTGEWALVYRNHCSVGNGDATICTPHRDYLMAGGRITCSSCKMSVLFGPHLIRIERIRP